MVIYQIHLNQLNATDVIFENSITGKNSSGFSIKMTFGRYAWFSVYRYMIVLVNKLF